MEFGESVFALFEGSEESVLTPSLSVGAAHGSEKKRQNSQVGLLPGDVPPGRAAGAAAGARGALPAASGADARAGPIDHLQVARLEAAHKAGGADDASAVLCAEVVKAAEDVEQASASLAPGR